MGAVGMLNPLKMSMNGLRHKAWSLAAMAARGAYLWLRPERCDSKGNLTHESRWLIRDGSKTVSTGCKASNREAAEAQLAGYITAKYTPPRKERTLSDVNLCDVLNIYLRDVAPGQARPWKAVERVGRLADFFGGFTLDDITGALCREYVAYRQKVTGKATTGGAKRDLEDLRAAINHHHAEGLHRESVKIILPKRGEPRQRWLSRGEFARLLWICWSTKELQGGKATAKNPLRHLCRFLLLGVYTGSRPGAVMSASWERGAGRSFIDLENGRFMRLAEGAVATDKRQTPVTIAPRLMCHLRRWKAIDGGLGSVVRFNGRAVMSVKVAMGTACRLAGLGSGVSGYTLRHTTATWLLNKGISVWDTAQFLGTSPEVIQKNYGHMSPDYLKDAAAAIGKK